MRQPYPHQTWIHGASRIQTRTRPGYSGQLPGPKNMPEATTRIAQEGPKAPRCFCFLDNFLCTCFHCASFAQPAKHSESPGRKARGLPRGHPERPKSTRRAPRRCKKGTKCVAIAPKAPPKEHPESTPRAPQEHPKSTQEATKKASEAPRSSKVI